MKKVYCSDCGHHTCGGAQTSESCYIVYKNTTYYLKRNERVRYEPSAKNRLNDCKEWKRKWWRKKIMIAYKNL